MTDGVISNRAEPALLGGQVPLDYGLGDTRSPFSPFYSIQTSTARSFTELLLSQSTCRSLGLAT